ncbi:putative N-acetyltransferase YhbS [Salirhabdus euzebyi]|uniref:Putative N-acetyltransferase YhbS n=1 Tax=Salirhabdus euzebyi TaxID=394506 RepID=A0A841Q8T9_9BACI|nr:N-acetyltransferase [Salirhabdus euzebyi]MBB6454820.1 putative N-acetyltransferase YhbS [Salirhabdus euzebyi]
MIIIKIREATLKDLPGIKATVKSAFYREGKHELYNEWEFAERVTQDRGFVKELCLVAVLDEEIVGYILLSKAQIGQKQGLSLGPLAVTKDLQNKGIGKKLVRKGLDIAKSLGYKWVVLLGGDYYLQFGFKPALAHNILLSEDNPENKYVKICFLNETDHEMNGIIRYCDSFYNQNGELL